VERGGRNCYTNVAPSFDPMNEPALDSLKSEALLRQITENIHEVFWITDRVACRMLYVSPAYETIWGRSVESLYQNPASFIDAIHPDDRPQIIRAIGTELEQPSEKEYRIIRPDGSVRWIRDQAFPVRDEKGEVYRWTGVATDVTEHKLAQDEIHRLNEELERRIGERTRELGEANASLEREIAEHCRTEDALREAQAAEKARTELIKLHRNVLLELAQLDEVDFDAALKKILKGDAETLDVERVSYWSLGGAPLTTEREMLYLKSRGDIERNATGLTFDAAHYPRYFAALATHRPIVAHRAQEDPACSEFTEGYLKPQGITSMLDVAVWSHGRMVGVLCHSHVGDPRDWSLEEIEFAASVAPRIALALEAAQRHGLTEALRESNQHLRHLIETTNDAFLSIDSSSQIIDWNAQAEAMFGWSREEALGRNMAELILPQRYRASHAKGIAMFLATGKGDIFRRATELIFTRRNGQEFFTEVSAWPMKTGRGFVFSAFIRDISERKREEEAMRRRAQRELLHRNTLLELAHIEVTDFATALLSILERDARTLGVERVSYWSLAHDHSAITCKLLYLHSENRVDPSSANLCLQAADHPQYFAAILTRRPVVANRAQEDPVTSEFTKDYLNPLGITSMLDVAVWFHGEVVGVVCHEHVGAPREWSAKEVDFASSIATMVSLALEASNRHRLLEALRRSEEKYRLVVEYAGEGIFITQDRRVRYANPRAVELFGVPAQKLIGVELKEFLHPDDRARVLGNYERRLRGEAIENNYTFRTLPRSRGSRSLQINAVAIDWEGRPATLSFIADVTERARLHQNLRQTLSEREAILETAAVGIVFVQSGVIRWINTILETQMLGYDKGELVGKRAEIACLSHEAYKSFLADSTPVLERGERYHTEIQFRKRDGSIFWCDFSGRAIDPGDLGKGSIWALMDITERRVLEDELTRTLSLREAILQNTLVGITFSINRRHVWLNQRMAQILGYATEELVGQSSVIHFPDEESWRRFGEIAYPILATGRSYSTETEMRRKDGSLIWCQVQGTAIEPAELSKGSIWTFTDITELKNAEQTIRKALDKEMELSELKSRFVSMTSHEFRTPLATILSATEMLERYSERLPAEEKAELLGLTKVAVKRMSHMLEEVLVIGRADSGRLAFNPQPVNVERLCRDIAEEIAKGTADGQRIVLRARGEERLRMLDEKLARHILGNLLSNAVKFSPPGSIVRFDVSIDPGETVFEVSDQGIGIPPEDHPHLFETFHRGRNVSNISGTGLGLAIVKRCVILHGGTIDFDSHVGQGTRFVVNLPAHGSE
jgi:PAS domain S-box-containing protein